MVFMYVIKVPSVLVTSTKKLNFLNSLSFATNFANKTMFSKFFSVCYLLRKSSLKFLFFHSKTVRPFKFHMIRIYSYRCRSSLPEMTCNFIKKGILAQVFSCEVCESFKSTFFNRTPSVAASAHDKFLVRFFRKELFFLPQNLFIYYFNVSKLSFNLQFFIFYLKCFRFYSLVFGSLTQFFIFLISTVNILKVS